MGLNGRESPNALPRFKNWIFQSSLLQLIELFRMESDDNLVVLAIAANYSLDRLESIQCLDLRERLLDDLLCLRQRLLVIIF